MIRRETNLLDAKFRHGAAHPKMPHAMNIKLMLSNHGNPAIAITITTEDSSQMGRTSLIMPLNNSKLMNY